MVVIRPPGRWQFVDLRELWHYRELAWTLALRDVQIRYRQTFIYNKGGYVMHVLRTLARQRTGDDQAGDKLFKEWLDE